MGYIQSLLELRTVQQPKLGLDDAKPVIHLKRISRLDEHQRVRRCRRSPSLAGGVAGALHGA
jgi:hypothetical protein